MYHCNAKTPPVTNKSVSWVGAWWIPNIILGSIGLINSLLFFKIPQTYPNANAIARKRSQDFRQNRLDKCFKPISQEGGVFSRIKVLLTSWAWMLGLAGFTFDAYCSYALATFGTKWQEVAFQIPANRATYGSGLFRTISKTELFRNR